MVSDTGWDAKVKRRGAVEVEEPEPGLYDAWWLPPPFRALLRGETVVLATPLPVADCRKRLEQDVLPLRIDAWARHGVFGSVDADRFRLYWATSGRESGAAHAFGRLRSVGGGTQVELRFAVPWSALQPIVSGVAIGGMATAIAVLQALWDLWPRVDGWGPVLLFAAWGPLFAVVALLYCRSQYPLIKRPLVAWVCETLEAQEIEREG